MNDYPHEAGGRPFRGGLGLNACLRDVCDVILNAPFPWPIDR